MYTKQEQEVLNYLYSKNVLPREGEFPITEFSLTEYIRTYHYLFGTTTKATSSVSNLRLARKLAGRTLLKELAHRGLTFTRVKAGMLYLIKSPAYPLHYKVGMTLDVVKRLAAYQTYSPYRDFEIEKYDFVLDRKMAESNLLHHPYIFNEQGEWIERTNALTLFKIIVQ